MRILLFVLPFFLLGCSHSSYLIENGLEQWRLFNKGRPVEEVLKSPYTKTELKEKIQTVEAAKHFAVRLGLNATKSYKEYVQLEEPYVSWAVSGAEECRLVEKKWSFPIVGEIPYLGFFKKKSAEKYAEKLKEKNPSMDVWVRGVPAYSSLGWFSDPLYSSMLNGTERDIAELVFHESLHATVWVGDSVDFNEKLASFVGLEASLLYMQKKGANAEAEALKEVKGEKIFADFLKNEIQRFQQEVAVHAEKPEICREKKKDFYRTMQLRYQKVQESHKVPKVNFAAWNNAALTAYANYYNDFSVFESLLKLCNKDLKRFVAWIKMEQEQNKNSLKADPEAHLKNLLQSGQACKPSLVGLSVF